MRRFFGILSILLGIAMIFGAVGLYLYNDHEDQQAQEAVDHYLPQVIQTIEDKIDVLKPTESQTFEESQELLTEIGETDEPEEDIIDPNYYSTEMTIEIIDGYGFIGYLTIPSLELQFPVLSETDDGRLKLSPCRFSGSTKTDNLVIGAHNYTRLFGKISSLRVGNEVHFTDMDGKLWSYRLASIETLQPNEGEILSNGEFPLTLYTCTYGGGSRLTLRFELITE